MKVNVLLRERTIRKVLFILLLGAAGMTKTLAQTFTVGDLNYQFIDFAEQTVKVTGHVNGTNATGHLSIPETVPFTYELNGEPTTITCTVTEIGYQAFYNCSKLAGTLTIPSSVTVIGGSAFWNCNRLTGSITITDQMTSIGSYAFYQCYGFTGNLTISNTVTTIGDYAFYSCGFNGSLTIGNSVTMIGEYAFYACNFTGNLVIPNSVTTIGACAFYGCDDFTGNLVLPNSITTIGERGFFYCTGFTGDLVIPDSLIEIESNVFRGCSGFTGLVIPNTVTTIRNGAFEYCSGFTGDLVIPNSVTTIEDYAFSWCTGFNGGLTLSNSATTIGHCAFQWCSGFTGSLTIPDSVTTIGWNAFYYCTGFTGGLTIGNSVTTIVNGAFYHCTGFTGGLTIPNSVAEIGMGAFWDCSGFTGSLTIGNSVTSIEEYAFRDCNGFDTIVAFCEWPPYVADNTFQGMSTSLPVYVPCGSLEEYNTALVWKNFTNIDEMCPHDISVTANPVEGGNVEGSGTYDYFSLCTLTATPNEGYTFVNWTLDGEVVSTEAEYSFAVTKDGNYVANFSNDITQTTTFNNGWTWWSTCIETAEADVLEQLKTGLGANGLVIKSQTASTMHLGNNWVGSLTMTNEGGFMVKTNAEATVEITGPAATPENHPITLTPGWTWIGYPSTEPMTVAEALANHVPQPNDVIKGQSASAMFMMGQWRGALTLTPGIGLMYKSNNSEPVTLTYATPTRNNIVEINPVETHWRGNYNAYPTNMTVLAVVELDGEELTSANYELAAFAGNECRGSVAMMYVEPLDRYMALLTISGEEATELHFGLYNAETKEECFNADETLSFEADAVIGEVDAPFVIRFRSTTGVDEWANSLQIFPNPVERGQNVSLGLSAEDMGKVQVEIINALGAVVETQSIASLRRITAPNVAGVYTLRITIKGKGTCYRKLIVR